MMKILLAIDASPCSRYAIAEIAKRPYPAGSELKIIAAVNPVFGEESGDVPERLRDDVAHFTRRQAAALLDEAMASLDDKAHHWTAVTAEVVDGPAPYAIVNTAERWGADMIVMSTHGDQRFFLGSVAHAVTVNAPCTVVVVREPRAAAAGND
jgi:nucleotide-binding universal stress UspA family protein